MSGNLKLKDIVNANNEIESEFEIFLKLISPYGFMISITSSKCIQFAKNNEGYQCRIRTFFNSKELKNYLEKENVVLYKPNISRTIEPSYDEKLEDKVHSIKFMLNHKPVDDPKSVKNFEFVKINDKFLNKMEVKCNVKRNNKYIKLSNDYYSKIQNELLDDDEIFIISINALQRKTIIEYGINNS